MRNKVISLVEDNPLDEALILRTLKMSNIVNEVVVARHGVKTLDFFFGTGTPAGPYEPCCLGEEFFLIWRPVRESNPCRRRERAVS